MSATPTIKSVMTPFPWSIGADQSVDEAWQMMIDLDIRHLPVTRAGELVGVVSARDIGLAREAVAGRTRGDGAKIGELCEHEPLVVETTTPLALVVDEMSRRRIDAALVVYRSKLAGIFTTTDACRVLAELLSDRPLTGGDDVA